MVLAEGAAGMTAGNPRLVYHRQSAASARESHRAKSLCAGTDRTVRRAAAPAACWAAAGPLLPLVFGNLTDEACLSAGESCFSAAWSPLSGVSIP